EFPLDTRAFDRLRFLAAHRHRVLTKTEMRDAVWPDITVAESYFTVQISELRKALGPRAPPCPRRRASGLRGSDRSSGLQVVRRRR
ncbi:MAG: winged helix-turn-helix domain-containing protein, partial [Maritimibacter sp.]|nr:winged helix-turn-helix domain-containing protein [Maritimibacter sp.]